MHYQHSSAVSIAPRPKYKTAINVVSALILVILLGTTVINLYNSGGYQRGYKPVVTVPSVEELKEERIESQVAPIVPPSSKSSPMVVQDLQPMATKISENIGVSPEQISIIPETALIYEDFWENFDAQAGKSADFNHNGTVEPLELKKFKEGFLHNLGYVIAADGMIYVQGSTVQVSPETLKCYFNGLVPGRGYIKPNCPPN